MKVNEGVRPCDLVEYKLDGLDYMKYRKVDSDGFKETQYVLHDNEIKVYKTYVSTKYDTKHVIKYVFNKHNILLSVSTETYDGADSNCETPAVLYNRNSVMYDNTLKARVEAIKEIKHIMGKYAELV